MFAWRIFKIESHDRARLVFKRSHELPGSTRRDPLLLKVRVVLGVRTSDEASLHRLAVERGLLGWNVSDRRSKLFARCAQLKKHGRFAIDVKQSRLQAANSL